MVPVPSGNSPVTRSPTAKRLTSEAVSITTPDASIPMTASSSGYSPKAIMTSRKLAGMVRTATRTWPGCSGASASGMGSRTRFSNVPLLDMPSRHGSSPGGTSSASTARLPCTRPVYTVSPRTTTCGSLAARTAAIVVSLSGASESTSTIRPGCSVCAERTNPHTAAPARSVTSSPGNPTAPRVDTTNTPASRSESQDCSAASTSWVRRYVAASGSPSAGSDSNTSYDGVSACDATDAADHTSSKSRSALEPETAAINCCCETGRATMEATDNTVNPSPSANSTDTADGPDGAIRARTADAPAACNDTPCHENGNATPAPS